MNDIIKEINRIKKEKNAVIVAHNYQIDEVQDIADLVGDSFALSKFCANNNADVIVFCGVHFMAESAKIISPKKTVILPEKHAGCPMANMVTAEALKKKKVEHPGAAVVCYINSSAEVKAESDICCTSSNAVNVVNSLEQKDIIFVPDENLGSYIAEKLPHKNIILWNGYCITHHKIKKDDVLLAKEKHPEAILLVHPECRKEIVDLANFVGSTKQIIDYAATSDAKEFIIGTEMGIMHKLKMESPDKKFYLMSPGLICPNMKKTTLDSILHSLQTMTEKIELDEDVRTRARKSLDRMLSVE
jgi:quinolinate synthase